MRKWSIGPLTSSPVSRRVQRVFELAAVLSEVKLPNGVTNVYLPLGRLVSPLIWIRWNVIWLSGVIWSAGAVAASTLKKMLTVPPGTDTSTEPPQ